MIFEIKKPFSNFGFKNYDVKLCEVECEKHGKTQGYSIGEGGNGICLKCEKEDKERELKEEEKRSFEKREKEKVAMFRSCNIELEFFYKEISDFVVQTQEQEKALKAVNEMIEKKSGKVILLGSNGIGKTFLGSMAVKALGGKILSMYEITTMIRQSYTMKAEKTELEIVQELATIPMLVIDEMGRTKGSEAELNWLSYILDKRHTRDLPFMILSNTHLKRDCTKKGCDSCFERFVNNDVLSRLRQNTQIITVKAPDYRVKEVKNG